MKPFDLEQTRGELMGFQDTGARFLAGHRYAGLFDEMGLGKTVQAIEAANMIKAQKVLVLAPHIALINWQREIERWSNLPTTGILSNQRPRSNAAWQITNFDMYSQPGDVWRATRQDRYDLIVIDECQALKNHDATRTRNIYGKHGVARCGSRLWALSGTPAPNHPGELYSLLLACYPAGIPVTPECDYPGRVKRHMSYQEFLDRYTRQTISRAGFEKITGGRNMEELRAAIAPFALRRTTAEVMPEMPPVRCTQLSFPPGEGLGFLDESEEAADVRIALQACLAKVMENQPDVSPDDQMMLALEIMDTEYLATARRLFGEALAPMVAEYAHEMLTGGVDKLVLFYHHRNVGNHLHHALMQHGAVRVDGATSLESRQHLIDAFQRDPSVKVIIAQIDVAHRVITLTAAHHLLFAECAWTPGINWQAIKRCSRIGQTLPVLARFATLAGSLHEVIMRVMLKKAQNLAELWNDPTVMKMEGIENAFVTR